MMSAAMTPVVCAMCLSDERITHLPLKFLKDVFCNRIYRMFFEQVLMNHVDSFCLLSHRSEIFCCLHLEALFYVAPFKATFEC